MAKESTSAYIFAIVGIVLIVGIVFVVQNLKMSSVSYAATTDTAGQAYSSAISSEACATYQCSDNEIAICYSDEDGDCLCPPCSTSEDDLGGQAIKSLQPKTTSMTDNILVNRESLTEHHSFSSSDGGTGDDEK